MTLAAAAPSPRSPPLPAYPQLCELQFAAWRNTLWADIKTDEMEEGAKGFVKEVKGLSKKVRVPACWE